MNNQQYRWRRERDSNPRYPFGYSGFQDRLFQPLTHPSAVGEADTNHTIWVLRRGFSPQTQRHREAKERKKDQETGNNDLFSGSGPMARLTAEGLPFPKILCASVSLW